MIATVYTAPGSASSKKAVKWFKDEGIPFREIRTSKEKLTKDQLTELLRLTDNGLADLLKRTADVESIIDKSLSFAIEYIIKHPEMLRVPLITDSKTLLIGYHVDSIRMFIPRGVRQIKIYNQLKCEMERGII